MRFKKTPRSLFTLFGICVTSVFLFVCLVTYSGKYFHVTIELKGASSGKRNLLHASLQTDDINNTEYGITQKILETANVKQGHSLKIYNGSYEGDLSIIRDKDKIQLTYCGINITENMNLLKMKRPPLHSAYKNPCWRLKTGRLRCMPYMYLIGVAKCGTTDLFSRIAQHPDFIHPSIKESNWLSAGRFWRYESFDMFTSRFFSPLIKALEGDSTHNKWNRLITGDASINTISGAHVWQYLGNNIGHDEPIENNPEYIHHLFNETRILINVRNPVDRLWSEYLAFSKNKIQTPDRFHDIVVKSIRMYTECTSNRTIRSCVYDRNMWQIASMSDAEVEIYESKPCHNNPIDIVMLQRGLYHVYIQDYLRVFERDHVLIQRLEDISEHPDTSIRLTYSFLGLRTLSKESINKVVSGNIKNAKRPGRRKVGEMLPETRELLYKFYKPHNEKLAEILDDRRYSYGPKGG